MPGRLLLLIVVVGLPACMAPPNPSPVSEIAQTRRWNGTATYVFHSVGRGAEATLTVELDGMRWVNDEPLRYTVDVGTELKLTDYHAKVTYRATGDAGEVQCTQTGESRDAVFEPNHHEELAVHPRGSYSGFMRARFKMDTTVTCAGVSRSAPGEFQLELDIAGLITYGRLEGRREVVRRVDDFVNTYTSSWDFAAD
jgi:hypothetical protein